ncbi:hypothetical protein IPG41_07125 [Candidatus Peregrinibacteria bacterium]|nr:MAG: hypothetical protein IPG41_07125 [Candidatus Peregrinibacteria bacterium]
MQKFTVFSLLLSLVVVLATVDVLFHDYLGEDPAVEENQTVEEIPEPLDTEPVEEEVELQEEKSPSWITGDLLTQAGFTLPVVKEALFSGLIFQIIPFSDASQSQLSQLNFFDGERYVGSFYEIVYPTDTGSFQAYLTLREAAKALPDLGTVNEVNMYGDASFYFNHKSKVKTVHMVALYGKRIYGFEYAQTEHEKMKKLFDILKSLQ